MARQKTAEIGSPSATRMRGVRMLLLVALTLVVVPALPHAEPQAATPESFFFIQMTDTQFGMSATPLLFSYLGLSWNDDEFEKESRLFEKAVEAANRLKPAFVVVCGDLVNKPGHAGQAAEFKRISQNLSRSIPLYLVAALAESPLNQIDNVLTPFSVQSRG